ncbi:hypothetical protein [Cohnella lupini]|uniref:Uncharacterized protein n=1 Tax=Cohnella lupini TaxID=1294267 RepID=A0A3D9HZF3_9BACL|nr:hypothetical protein [Cohnella lupini]RED54751.1 hypothetical protein DFP95_1217 [Cohnella lupini]
MILFLGILALIVAIILWVAKVAIGVVSSFGVIGFAVVIIGLILLMRGRRNSV